jgi:hypothetical protein
MIEKYGVSSVKEQQEAELRETKRRQAELEATKSLEKRAADEAGRARKFDEEDREAAQLAVRAQELETALAKPDGQ